MSWSKDQRERFVAEQFCLALGDAALDPEHRERPDFLVRHPAADFGVEITEVRQLGPLDTAAGCFRSLSHDICGKWIDDPRVHHWSLWLRFRYESARTARGVGAFLTPKPVDRSKFIEQLKALAVRVGRVDPEDGWCVWIGPGGHRPEMNVNYMRFGQGLDDIWRHCSHVKLTHHKDVVCGMPHSNLDSSCVGCTDAAIFALVAKKLDLLPAYRKKLPNNEIHLLIYGGGETITRYLPADETAPRIRRAVAELAEQSRSQFDAIWYGEHLCMQSVHGPRVQRVGSRPASAFATWGDSQELRH